MNDSFQSIPIEAAAAKLATAENLTDPALAKAIQEEPRLRELILFLQWLSMQPGGLPKPMCQLVDDFAPQFGPACLHAGKAPTFEQRLEAWGSLCDKCKGDFIPRKAWRDLRERDESIWMEDCGCPAPHSPSEKKLFRSLLLDLDTDDLRDAFLSNAKEELPSLIRSLFNELDAWQTPAPWYCQNILAVLFEAMELHARRVELQLARTKIVEIVFDRLDFAVSEKRLIKIDGQARTGKSEAAHAFAHARPGRLRIISTPPGTSTRDLFAAVAESLCIAFSAKTAIYKIKEAVQFVIRHARLGFIFDEAQFLLPPPSSQAQSPARLDWVRCNIVDRKLPCALICTPQTFNHAVRNLRDKRGYNFDQVLGRIDLNVTLPDTLGKEDLEQVIKIHGAGIPQNLHAFIVEEVLIKEAYLKSFEAICCRARHLARRDGNRTVNKADVECAISEVIPQAAAVTAAPAASAKSVRKTASPVAVKRGTRPAPAHETAPQILEAPASRQITPSTELQPV
jgi:hypothetical protein